jgi:hypothetical protein
MGEGEMKYIYKLKFVELEGPVLYIGGAIRYVDKDGKLPSGSHGLMAIGPFHAPEWRGFESERDENGDEIINIAAVRVPPEMAAVPQEAGIWLDGNSNLYAGNCDFRLQVWDETEENTMKAAAHDELAAVNGAIARWHTFWGLNNGDRFVEWHALYVPRLKK